LFAHYKREEEAAALKSGKLDEELDSIKLGPQSVLLGYK